MFYFNWQSFDKVELPTYCLSAYFTDGEHIARVYRYKDKDVWYSAETKTTLKWVPTHWVERIPLPGDVDCIDSVKKSKLECWRVRMGEEVYTIHAVKMSMVNGLLWFIDEQDNMFNVFRSWDYCVECDDTVWGCSDDNKSTTSCKTSAMKVVKQLCIKSCEITAKNGDYFKVRQGEKYTTSIPRNDKKSITVFSNYWVTMPKECFVIAEE